MSVCGYERVVKCSDPGQDTCEGRCWQHCSFALEIQMKMNRLHTLHLTDWQVNERYMDLMDVWIDHAVEKHNHIDVRPKKFRNGKYNGPFAFTLTMSPSDGLTEEDMILACRKIMDQKSQPVKKFVWYLEYKDPELKTHPHIHGMYETENGRRIEKKHWVRQWKIWDESIPLGAGFRGGYHRPVRQGECYAVYISKQNGVGESHL